MPGLLIIVIAILLGVHSIGYAGASTNSSCNLPKIIGKIILPSQDQAAASHWKTSHSDLFSDFDFKSGLKKPPKLLQVQKSSLAATNPELTSILRDVEGSVFPYDRFTKEFKKVFGRDPLHEDYLDYYQKRFEIYRSGMDALLKEIKKTNPERAAQWESTVKVQTENLSETLQSALKESRPDTFKNKIEAYSRETIGSLTELQVGVGLDGVQKVSQVLGNSEPIVQKLNAKLAAMEKSLSAPGGVERWSERFPKIMKYSAREAGKTHTPQSRINEIRKWILSKEIDVVREVNGKTKWLEVKRNGQVFTAGVFDNAGVGKKSYLYQIQETNEIIHFLELEDQIGLEYLATGGMDAHIKNTLRVNGVDVLDP